MADMRTRSVLVIGEAIVNEIELADGRISRSVGGSPLGMSHSASRDWTSRPRC